MPRKKMNEYPISITNLNDFIFCPISIYFHNLDSETDKLLYQDEFQINGSAKHENPDKAAYSSKKSMLQGIAVFCEEYGVFGKIDVFDNDKGILTERKKKIKAIYDGYVFQIYAQYFALKEMGYKVNSLRLYSMDDNKIYPITKPENDLTMFEKFKDVINDIRGFNENEFVQTNKLKCKNCIYEPLCSYSKEKEYL